MQSVCNFTIEMKRNLFTHMSVLILVLLTCTFSFVHANARVKNFNLLTYSDQAQQKEKFINTPGIGSNSSFDNLFENETKDENETEFNAALPILNLSQNFSALLFSDKIFFTSSCNNCSKNFQDCLFLIIHSIRI